MIIEKEKAKKKKKLFSLINLLIMTLLSKQKKNSFSKREYGSGVAKKFVCLELISHGKKTKEWVD